MKKNFLDQLNLRPAERRVVIIVAVICFVVLNAWFVWPHFGDAGKGLATINKGRLDWTNHYETIQQDTKKGGTKAQIAALLQEQGAGASLEGSREIQLQRKVQEKAPQYGVTVLNYAETPATAFNMGKTNAFFEERSLRISVQCGESNLVNFLYDIGNDSSMIRVRELRLKPVDQNRYRLSADVLLSANFPKKQPEPVRATTTPARGPATAVPKPTMNSSGQKKPPAKL